MKVGAKSAVAEVEIQELSHQVGERISGYSACAGALIAWFTGDYALTPSAPATEDARNRASSMIHAGCVGVSLANALVLLVPTCSQSSQCDAVLSVLVCS